MVNHRIAKEQKQEKKKGQELQKQKTKKPYKIFNKITTVKLM